MTENPFTVKLEKIQVNGAYQGFTEVAFRAASPTRILFDLVVHVDPKSVDEEDVLKQARNRCHNILRALAEKTADWEIATPDEKVPMKG